MGKGGARGKAFQNSSREVSCTWLWDSFPRLFRKSAIQTKLSIISSDYVLGVSAVRVKYPTPSKLGPSFFTHGGRATLIYSPGRKLLLYSRSICDISSCLQGVRRLMPASGSYCTLNEKVDYWERKGGDSRQHPTIPT